MKVVFIVGPTGSGKSDLAMKWAKASTGHIVNADSVQFFKSLNIGANKPSPKAQAEVPHHLFSIVKEGQHFTAGDFRRIALQTLTQLAKQNCPYVFVVGGSGFYIQALIKGMPSLPKVSKEIRNSVIQELKTYGLDSLYKQIKWRDPAYAKKIHPQDTHRIIRGVEILRRQPQTITEMMEKFEDQPFPYPKALIGLKCDRTQLKNKIQKRTANMLASGLIEEVHHLIERGLKDWRPLQSVGYKQVVGFLDGQIKKEHLFDEIVQANMRLAKKQMTWFKNKYIIHWIECNQQIANIFKDAGLYN